MRILITGAGGFVGVHLAAAIEVMLPSAVVIGTGSAPPLGLDVGDPAQVGATICDAKPTHVVHLAAVSSVPEAESDPHRAFRVNQCGPLNLGLAITAHAPSCRLLIVSSSEVYGRSFDGRRPVTEDMPLLPTNVYAASKAAGEMAVLGLVPRGLRVLIARPFSHTGPGQAPRFALPAFAAQIAAIERGEKDPVIRTGRLDAVRDFIDVRDVCSAYVRLIERFDLIPTSAAINIAGGEGRTIGALLDMLMALARVPMSREIDPSKVRPHDAPWTVGDAGKARSLLDWAPVIPIERSLAELLDTMRANQA